MDTKTAKAELVKGLEEALEDEVAAINMYSVMQQSFHHWYDSYPEGNAPVPDADYLYMLEQVLRIQQAEALHRKTLTGIRDRIRALPDG